MQVVEVAPTPNPNAMKIILDGSVCSGTKSYFNVAMAKDDPLATRLFAIPGVKGVMLLGSFITVSKSPDAAWDSILPEVKMILAEN